MSFSSLHEENAQQIQKTTQKYSKINEEQPKRKCSETFTQVLLNATQANAQAAIISLVYGFSIRDVRVL